MLSKKIFFITLIVVFQCGFVFVSAMHPSTPTDLKSNLLREALNIPCDADIRLSWVFHDDDFNEFQTAYQVEITEGSNAFDVLLVSTGWVNTQTSAHMLTADMLQDNSLYYWRVKTRDKDGNESPWSEPATLVTEVGDRWVSQDGLWLIPSEKVDGSHKEKGDFIFLRHSFNLSCVHKI